MLQTQGGCLLRQAGPALQQVIHAGADAVAAAAGGDAAAARRQVQQQQQRDASPQPAGGAQAVRALSTSSCSQAPRFHENLRVPAKDPIFNRENYNALKAQGWSLEAIEAFLRANPRALRAIDASSRGAARASADAKTGRYAVSLVRQCNSLADLRAVVSEHAHMLTPRAVAAAIARIPSITPPGGAAGAERLLDRLLPQLLSADEGGSSGAATLPAAAAAGVLSAVARCSYPLPAAELDLLLSVLEARLPGASAGDAAAAAAAAAALAPRRDTLWAAIETAAVAAIEAARQSSSSGGSSGGRQRAGKGADRAAPLPTGPDAVEQAAQRAAALSPAAAVAPAVAGLSWAHASAGRAPPALVRAVSLWVMSSAGGAAHLQPRDLTFLLKAGAEWAELANKASSPSSTTTTSSSGSSSSGSQQQEQQQQQRGAPRLRKDAVARLLDVAAEKLWQFSAPEMDALLSSAARLGAEPSPALLAAIAKQLDHPNAAFSAAPGTLATALSAAARAGVDDGGRSLLRAAAVAMTAAPAAFSAGDAANAAWAAAAMGAGDEAFYTAALSRLTDCVSDCAPHELTHALLGSCGTTDPLLRARLLAAAAPVLASRGADFSARDAASALRVLRYSSSRGELAGTASDADLAAAAAALGGAVLRHWRAGGVSRAAADDAAASVAALCGDAHPTVAALRAGADGAAAAEQQQQQPGQGSSS